jgi:membrane protein implicated in regulation of membrane protease activity
MDFLLKSLSLLQAQHWLALAFILMIAEMLTGTTYLLWPAVAAGITGLIAFSPALGWQWHLALFAVLTIVLTLVGRPLRNRLYHMRAGASPMLNERAASMVGQRGATAGPFVDGLGSVRINDSIWRAKSAEPITAGGVPVQVLSVDGSTLTVKPAS